MTSARTPSSHPMAIINSEAVEDSATDSYRNSGRARLPCESESPNSQCSEYLGPTTSTLFQAPEIRSPRSFSRSIPEGDSIKSSSSLPAPPKTSFDEWKGGTAQKLFPKTFHEPACKVSTESEQPPRQGWEWIWVLGSNRVKRESSEPLSVPKEKLTAKRLRRSLPVGNTEGLYTSNSQNNSSSSHEEYTANQDDKETARLSTLSHDASCSLGMSQSRSKLFRGLQYMSPTYPHFKSPTGEPEGLYCKTKRGIGLGLIWKPKEDISKFVFHSREELPSRATATLQGATSVLGRSKQDAAHPNIHFHTGGRSPSTASQRPGRQIGIAPWHRRNSQDSTWSVTSSIREVLRGKTPVTTPSPEMQYGGHQGKKYAKVDITRKEEPTFLPSEAAQVQTPPTSSAGAASVGFRGFSLGLTPSGIDQESGIASGNKISLSPDTSQTATKVHTTFRARREWWDDIEASLDSDAPAIMTQIEPVIRGQIEAPRLEWNTPEHLPNSPLCPLINEKTEGDAGNGNGICVYHGWKRRLDSVLEVPDIDEPTFKF